MSGAFIGLFVIASLVALFYYTKFEQSEKEYYKLHKEHIKALGENGKLRSRVKDLQSYKDDISKTFKILDNELVMINEHINQQKKDDQNDSVGERGRGRVEEGGTSVLPPMLTPEILNRLFDGINSERVFTAEISMPASTGNDVEGEAAESGAVRGSLIEPLRMANNRYEEFLM